MRLVNLISSVVTVVIVSCSSGICATPLKDTGYENFLSCIKGDGKSCVNPESIYSNEINLNFLDLILYLKTLFLLMK